MQSNSSIQFMDLSHCRLGDRTVPLGRLVSPALGNFDAQPFACCRHSLLDHEDDQDRAEDAL